MLSAMSCPARLDVPVPATAGGGGTTAPPPPSAGAPLGTARCSAIGSRGEGAITSEWPILMSPNFRAAVTSTFGGGATTAPADFANREYSTPEAQVEARPQPAARMALDAASLGRHREVARRLIWARREGSSLQPRGLPMGPARASASRRRR